MSKRVFLTCCVLAVVASGFAQTRYAAQNQKGQAINISMNAMNYSHNAAAGRNQSDSIKGIHPYKDADSISHVWNHWSVFLDAGFNIFDGDFGWSILDHCIYGPTVNVGFNYNFTSTWGIGAFYGYGRYGVKGNKNWVEKVDPNPVKDNILLRGQIHKVGAYLNADVFNAFRPWDKHKLFDLSIIAGGGTSWFTRDHYHFRFEVGEQNPQVDATAKQKWETLMDDQGAYQNVGFLMGGADFQFNITRSVSIGWKLLYSYYLNDLLDGRRMGNNNDGIVDVTLSGRYKIDAVKHSHVLNAVHYQMRELFLPYMNPNDVARIVSAIEGITRVDTLVLTPDTIVITNIVPQAVAESESLTIDPYYYVYFDNDEDVLTDDGLRAIQQAADAIARAGDSIRVAIIGHCDNTGTIAHNEDLATRRAAKVADELNAEYGIVAAEVIDFGQGITYGRSSKASYSPYRRVDIILFDKSEFDSFMVEQEMYKKQRTLIQKNLQSVKAAKGATGRTVSMPSNSSLARLAQQEYGNAYCWIYIYEANMDKISNPDKVQDGIILTLPALSQEQKAINAQQTMNRLSQLTLPQVQPKAQPKKDVKAAVAPAEPQQIITVKKGSAQYVGSSIPGNQLAAQQQQTPAPAAVQQQPQQEAQTPAPTQVQQGTDRPKTTVIATEVTRRDWTLTKMARKHYGNAHCWVYIYQQNRYRITDPDKVPEGTKVFIPMLTPEQQAITRDQAKSLAESIKASNNRGAQQKAGKKK